MDKTFFLGLGGQKCGSTWIRAYLARQPGSDFGRLGEYQRWEHRLGGVFARYAIPDPSAGQRLRARLKMALGAPEPAAHLRWRLQADPQTYFYYFAKLCSAPGTVRTGDVTPSYAALPAETLREIRNGFEARGFKVKLIFSMRDPVARLSSHLKMDMDKGRIPPSDRAEALRAFYATAEAEGRSRYDLTLKAIAEAFAPEDCHICLFEELFTPAGTEALARFAGVPADLEAGQTKVNARGSSTDVPEDLQAAIARHYAPAYAAAADILPQSARLWPSARFLTTA